MKASMQRKRFAPTAGWAFLGLSVVLASTIGTATLAEAKTKYYLTRETFQGDEVLTACDKGYHTASRWEILDPSALQYDTSRGLTLEDSGFGPPSYEPGWIRTGYRAYITGGTGVANCGGWTTSSNAFEGTSVGLTGDLNAIGAVHGAWWADEATCDKALRVWCVRK